MSIKNLSEPVRLEQLAEESAELGHAALKHKDTSQAALLAALKERSRNVDTGQLK